MTVDCTKCKRSIELPTTNARVEQWRSSGQLIQRALPELNADERELLISGYCGKCFDALFADDDEEPIGSRFNDAF
jgi:hypothetical protein